MGQDADSGLHSRAVFQNSGSPRSRQGNCSQCFILMVQMLLFCGGMGRSVASLTAECACAGKRRKSNRHWINCMLLVHAGLGCFGHCATQLLRLRCSGTLVAPQVSSGIIEPKPSNPKRTLNLLLPFRGSAGTPSPSPRPGTTGGCCCPVLRLVLFRACMAFKQI